MRYFLSILVFSLLWLLPLQKAQAQMGMSHEIGFFLGPANFLTDYGERWNLKNNVANAGMGVGLVHFMHFAHHQQCNIYDSGSFFKGHFRIRNELNFLRSNLEHYGPVASQPTIGGQLLRAMHGVTHVWELGTHLEYHPLGIRRFSNFGYWFSPYIAAGIHYVNYKPDAYSDLGPLEDTNNIFPAFQGGINLDRGSTFSVVGILGARYKLGVNHDLMVEARYHYYGNDWIDGLNHNAPQNKYNDLVFWVNIGYVYYLSY
jgi:hypothetical protein